MRALADTGNQDAADRLAELLYDRADETELLALADTGNEDAADRLAWLLYDRGDETRLLALADTGNQDAADRLAELLYDSRDEAGLRALADTGNQEAAYRLVRLLYGRGDEAGLRILAESGNQAAGRWLARLLDGWGDEAGLWVLAKTGNRDAGRWLAELLYDRGDETGLRALVETGNPDVADRLARLLYGRGDEASDAAALRMLEIFHEGNTAWHDQWRLAALRHLAQRLLCQDADHEKMLYAQHDGGPWAQLRDNLESDGLGHEYFAGFKGWALNMEGRGGSHVWRVKRQVTIEGLLSWLLGSIQDQPRPEPPERLWPATETSEAGSPEAGMPTVAFLARTPDWGLSIPPGWEPVVLSQLDPLPPKARKIADDGKALLLESDDPPRRFLWPMRRRSRDGPLAPVPGIDTVLSVLLPATRADTQPSRADLTARTFTAVHAAELIHTLCEERDSCIPPVQFMPAHIAHSAGLIDLPARDALVEKARADTQRNMRRFAEALAQRTHHPRIPALWDAMTSLTEFRKIAFSIGLPKPLDDWIDQVQEKPVFEWSVSSLADQVMRGTSPIALAWLAKQLRQDYIRELKADRLRAWQRAFDYDRIGHGMHVWGRAPRL